MEKRLKELEEQVIRYGVYWDAQHEWNKDRDKKHTRLEARVSSLERKIIWVAGVAAGVGGAFGNIFF